jgi:hypothetical protein
MELAPVAYEISCDGTISGNDDIVLQKVMKSNLTRCPMKLVAPQCAGHDMPNCRSDPHVENERLYPYLSTSSSQLLISTDDRSATANYLEPSYVHVEGTMTSVHFAAQIPRPDSSIFVRSRAYIRALSRDPVIAASIVNVFPRPISSATMPPVASAAEALLAPVIAC